MSDLVTETQRRNLKTLATYLAANGDLLNFAMTVYAASEHGDYLGPDAMAEHPCGSVGCAVGHGPVAGVAPLPGEDWNGYAFRAFGASSLKTPEAEKVWDGIFVDDWAFTDNSPQGAADRIERFLATGELRDVDGGRIA